MKAGGFQKALVRHLLFTICYYVVIDISKFYSEGFWTVIIARRWCYIRTGDQRIPGKEKGHANSKRATTREITSAI